MSGHNIEQLRQWLQETEDLDDCESVFGVEDPDEVEEDHLHMHDEDLSDEIGGDGPLPDLSQNVSDEEMEDGVDLDEMAPVEDFSAGTFVNPEFYMGKDRQTRWYLDPQLPQTSRTRRHNIITTFHRPGPQGNARLAQTPTMAFQCIIDDEIITKIVDCTNIYICLSILSKVGVWGSSEKCL